MESCKSVGDKSMSHFDHGVSEDAAARGESKRPKGGLPPEGQNGDPAEEMEQKGAK